MKTEILKLAAPLGADAAAQAGARLSGLPGVHEVSFLDAPARLYARIDDHAPTRAELVAALNAAGVLVDDAREPHASGSCCGGCGS
ncbi:MAG: hypothetical protein B7X93_06590 [Hydrogenophilales bacterium 17-61-9]|nr:MAG: hypothetical protein B7X93_06590 [Hydrogenophilales bacterium 17-61-9]